MCIGLYNSVYSIYALCVLYLLALSLLPLLLLLLYSISTKKQHFVQPYIIAIYMQFHGTKHEAILDDERRRNQMVAKASIYFF